ncbi:uncharacterized protein LOC126571276 [Anopheles aquasalis]|uniref:uncharacterized protein LOC126571276 n=1 Tax=Anopheles aquasalis TaxID=42839 RepID=UPI00215B3199|nr:uncharacterized protein LOC126571276 [Anopheles aquasalis]
MPSCTRWKISPTGKKIESKPQLARALGDTIDLSTFDYPAGRIIAPPSMAAAQLLHAHHGPQSYPMHQQQQQPHQQHQGHPGAALRRKLPAALVGSPLFGGATNVISLATPISSGGNAKPPSHQYDYR